MICTSCFSTNSTCRTCGGAGFLPDTPDDKRGVTRDLRLFGTAECPLHASAVPGLMQCSWKAALMFLFDPGYESSAAADTGSATHVAVSAWHKNKDLAAAIREMREVSERKFTQADLSEAAAMFLLYARDPRNQEATFATDKDGRPIIEYPVEINIRPAAEDQTEQEITVVGTLDQVRIGADNRLRVWDLKTSKKPGADQLNMYLYQVAVYAIGASAALGREVRMGGLITPRHYTKTPPESRPAGVFWEFPQKFDDIQYLINGVRHIVAGIRNGAVFVGPGDYCRYCVTRGTDECLPLLRSVSDPGTLRISLRTV